MLKWMHQKINPTAGKITSQWGKKSRCSSPGHGRSDLQWGGCRGDRNELTKPGSGALIFPLLLLPTCNQSCVGSDFPNFSQLTLFSLIPTDPALPNTTSHFCDCSCLITNLSFQSLPVPIQPTHGCQSKLSKIWFWPCSCSAQNLQKTL